MNSTELDLAVAEFVKAPTRSNRDSLISAADAYRDWWIEAQVSAPSAKLAIALAREAVTPRSASPTSYDKEMSTKEIDADGVPVRLVLQERTSNRDNASWWVVSWRTRLRAGGPNRRFYKTQGHFWSLPARIALELMRELETKGALQGDYDDGRFTEPGRFLVSDDLADSMRQELLREITGPDEDWGPDPLFVVADDPNPEWRKVMIVNRRTEIATFRSLTTSTSYRPRTELRPGCAWALDNSMMDTGAQQIRKFLSTLNRWAA